MRSWFAIGVLASLLVAGCTGGGGGDPPVTPIDPATGSIRGLVVDSAIVPVEGAFVTLTGGQNATTDAAGLFTFTGLQPGSYVLSAGKPGYRGIQTNVDVEAGVEPELTKLQIERIATALPYLEHFKLEGYYSCTFALPFITDSCEFGYRTAWDAANETGTQPPVSRSLLDFRNTQLIFVGDDTFTIVQEGFWDEEAVPVFWIMIDETPIANNCDCSTSYGNRIGPMPLLNRLERYDALGKDNKNFTVDEDANDSPKGVFPLGKTVASRGFIPFQEYPVVDSTEPTHWAAAGVQFQFTVMTTLFHNYVPDPDWTFETRADFPVPDQT